MARLKFTKITLDSLLDEIVDTHFEEGNEMLLAETIDYVKGVYADEIETLEDGPLWISGGN